MPATRCATCDAALNDGLLYRRQRTLKSCPNCSQRLGGGSHVFHEYPRDFTSTTHRQSEQNPDGAQSWCNRCRGNKDAAWVGISCEDAETD